ncbi:MAG TPA: hypothetical protein VG148_08370 [Pyrinomonadaceae bacterium]|nr:hypothetical protein [Pyrinomonadaceae bacterium]
MSNSRKRAPRGGKRRLVAILAAVILVLGLGVVFTQASRQGNGRAKTPKAAPTVNDGKTYVATREITVDKQTGKVRKPTAEETQELVASLKQLTSRSTEGLTAKTLADGTKQVTLEGRFGPVTIARPRADGTMEIKCVTNFEDAAEFLGLVEAGAAAAQ